MVGLLIHERRGWPWRGQRLGDLVGEGGSGWVEDVLPLGAAGRGRAVVDVGGML